MTVRISSYTLLIALVALVVLPLLTLAVAGVEYDLLAGYNVPGSQLHDDAVAGYDIPGSQFTDDAVAGISTSPGYHGTTHLG